MSAEEHQRSEKRPDWDEYFLEVMKAVAKRATCDRGRSGSVIVKNKRILTTGYVGAPAGLHHCDEAGHKVKSVTHEDGSVSQHCVRTSHAEENAIIQAARHGISLDGATLYSKMVPCYTCAKMIINAGVSRVVSENDYHASRDTKEIFKQAGVELIIVNNKTEEYPDQ
ncbi:MAG: cytidine/deoxycytidylate deaminase family protein [Candidatus Aenigmarchaeota archaeon]|nr:cytidine/deoxycytidylate deaminase family protein [Candidatus Aenigmarchaeota archaeon]MDI6722883.1 cytidine/deoxycytidylate deaminase family protein [Candidatus Aenigmarchaeota archaeon]